MSYLKQRLEDHLKTIDVDDMETLLLRNQIKTLIEVSESMQTTIGKAAYGDVKFERIKKIKGTDVIKADFTPEELKDLDNQFDKLIDKANAANAMDESNIA